MSWPVMHSVSGRHDFAVRMIGRAASRVLGRAQRGRVAAVFRSTFYLELSSGLVCVGSEVLEPSPVNLITAAPAGTDWQASGLRNGMPIQVSNATVFVGGRFSFPFSRAEDWSPEALCAEPNAADLERGLLRLQREVRNRPPREGIGRLLDPVVSACESDAVTKVARAPAAAARCWVASAIKSDAKVADDCGWVGALAGLGPGLTPSGDDFIGGAMIALRALGEHDACERVWTEACSQPGVRSNPISFAHLSAAAAGEGGAPIHRLLNNVITGRGDQIAASCDDIDRIGHSSGWDAVAGLCAGLDGWLDAHRY